MGTIHIYPKQLLHIIYFGLTTVLAQCLFSCTRGKEHAGGGSPFVINELMASNHSGVVANDGNLYDWIEVKNTSESVASLGGHSLKLESQKKNGKSKGKGLKAKTWSFPDLEVAPGGCVLVFATKKNQQDPRAGLQASFKLSSEGGKLSLLAGSNTVDRVEYGNLEDDQCYKRLADDTFETSYEPTPGFANDSSGYERYNTLISEQRKGPLRLWELHSKGNKIGRAFVEVRNVSDKPVPLRGYSLCTGKDPKERWQFPDVDLQPGKVYVVEGKKSNLAMSGQKSVMLTKSGRFVDGINAGSAPYGVSVGRVEGKDGFFFFPSPSRGSANTGSHYRYISQQPSFTPGGGVYSSQQSIKVAIKTHGQNIRYTTDGSEPTSSSRLYKDTLTLDSTTTIRAYCEGDSTSMRSKTATCTFFLGQAHTLPVMNVTLKPSDLFDYHKGIYERGPGASETFPHIGANYWKKWWKPAHVEFYDGEGGFSEACEMAIFGGYSRALAKKSFKIKFSETRGVSRLCYDLFGDGRRLKYKNFILRSGSQDIGGVMVRDEFFTSLMRPNSPTMPIQAYRPIALYLNGRYFGLYYIREKIDKRFVARHLNVSSDSITIIMANKYCEEGSPADYHALMAYAKQHNLSEQEHYDYIRNRFDLNSLIDFKLGQIYSSNTDVGNVRYVKSDDAKGDRKWHVVFYDLDATWTAEKPVSFYLNSNSSGMDSYVSIQNKLIDLLLHNQHFRQLFLERLSLHMHKTFTASNATSVFDALIDSIKSEMVLNCKRWPRIMTYDQWEHNVAKFRSQFADRSKLMLNGLRKYLSITDEEEKKYFADLGF